jgi:hypothetical protein
MVTLKEFIRRSKRLKPFVEKESAKIFRKRSKEITQMVKDQHHEGIGEDSKQMQSGYSKGYKGKRKKKGLQTKFVDLHFSGKYHKQMRTVPVKGGADLDSNVDYEKYIEGRFPTAKGLTKKNAEREATIMANILAPEIKKFLVG